LIGFRCFIRSLTHSNQRGEERREGEKEGKSEKRKKKKKRAALSSVYRSMLEAGMVWRLRVAILV
jgi:hypothetical protein